MQKLSEIKYQTKTDFRVHDPNFIGFDSNETMEMVYNFALENLNDCNLLDLNCLRCDLLHYIHVNNKNIRYQGLNLRADEYDTLRQFKYGYVNDDFIGNEVISLFIDSDGEKFQTNILESIKKIKFNKLIILTKDNKDYQYIFKLLKDLEINFLISVNTNLNYLKIELNGSQF